MTYIIEPATSVRLEGSRQPYAPPINPVALVLEFVVGDYPPLPWVKPSLVIEYRAPMGRASVSHNDRALTITPATPADDERGAHWITAIRADLERGARFEDADHRDAATAGSWGEADAVHQVHSSDWLQSSPVDRFHVNAWGTAYATDRTDYVSQWIMKTAARDSLIANPWYTVNLTGSVYVDSGFVVEYLNRDTATTISLNAPPEPFTVPDNPAAVLLQVVTIAPELRDRPIVPHDKTMRVTARQANDRDTDKRIPWGTGQSVWQDWNLPYPVEDNDEPPPEPTDPPERRTVYLIMNTLSVIDVATGTPLDVQDVRISLDIDSISWKFSGTVYGQGSLDLVRPDEGGMKDIIVTINGHAWTFAIERYTSDERFPTSKFGITGVSRTQYMAAPFAPTRSYTNASATTAAQAATAELENTGFTLTWPTGGDKDLPSWPIPAGALSFRDKSPAQVIAQIVTAAGGIMVPHRNNDAWTIQPRYTTPPWQWDSVQPDTAIYIGMIRSRSAQFEPAQAYDACFVSGINQGVSVDVQLTGSGGLNPMPDVFDDLITDAQAAISRGRNELAATGNKVIETLSVLIPESGKAPGILVPGQIIRITHDDEAKDYTGLVLANSISVQRAGGAEIFQSVTLERRA